MTETLAVFRSRSQAVDCLSRLRSLGISAQIINTPQEANVGCGFSVKFQHASASRAKNVISKMNYSAFYGYLKIDNRYGRFSVRGF